MKFRAPRTDEERCTAVTNLDLEHPRALALPVRCQTLANHDDPDYARENLDPYHRWETSDRATGADPMGRHRDQTIRVTWKTLDD